jgi:Ca2+-binding RTX toxin-like protein
VPGTSPVWSPDGSEIAFARDSYLHVVQLDGSGDRLAYPGPIEWGPSDWAPRISLPPGPPCIRFGTAAGGRITGTRFDDVVLGRAGADRIALGAGDDQALGDTGSDTIDGGPGADWIEGDEGSDRLTGGPGADHLFGGPGDDTIIARDGVRDSISCGPGHDTVVADRIDVVARNCERVRRG